MALLLAGVSFNAHEIDRYKYPERFASGYGGSAETARQSCREQAVEVFLEPLEQRLRVATYLGGSTACAVDIGIFPFVRQFAAVDPSWFASQPLSAVQTWLNEWLGSALFQHCMPKIPSDMPQPFPTLQDANQGFK
jgi:glutathione S-transferase